MKKFRLSLIAISMMTVLSGCLTSQTPFFQESDIVTDDRIIGFYDSGNNSGNVSIYKNIDPNLSKQYVVGIMGDNHDPNCHMKFNAILFQIGTNRFMDLLPQLESCDHSGGVPPSAIEILQALTLQPLHLLVKVNVTTNGVQFGIMDVQGLNKAVKEAKEFFQLPDDPPRMIADTKRQREFLLRFGGDTNIFKMGEIQKPKKN